MATDRKITKDMEMDYNKVTPAVIKDYVNFFMTEDEKGDFANNCVKMNSKGEMIRDKKSGSLTLDRKKSVDWLLKKDTEINWKNRPEENGDSISINDFLKKYLKK